MARSRRACRRRTSIGVRNSAVLLTDDDLVGESHVPAPDAGCRRSPRRRPGSSRNPTAPTSSSPPGFENREGDPLPLIVRRAPAASTMQRATSPASIDRTERLGADLMLYVVGCRPVTALSDGVRGGRMAGWLDAADRGRARPIRHRARRRPQATAKPARASRSSWSRCSTRQSREPTQRSPRRIRTSTRTRVRRWRDRSGSVR